MKVLKSLLLFAVIAAAFVLGATPANAQSMGTISLGGASCPNHSATINWSTDPSAPDNIAVWVSVSPKNQFPPNPTNTLVAASRSGSTFVDWLQSGYSYTFILYDSAGPAPSYTQGNFVASVNIGC